MTNDELKALGWTPHSDDEWVGLDEGELQVNDGCGWHQIDIRGLDGLLDLLEALTSKSHGPAAVRVRKRGGS